MIVVIDYGMGNLHSVRKALEVVGAKVKVNSHPEDIKKAKKIVFPGVGAFGEAMKELKRRSLVQPIKDAVKAGTPFLGLCLGMQLLFEKSDEAPGMKGLCVLDGEVKRFKVKGLKVPHMGWNEIIINKDDALFANMPENPRFYFVHSYYLECNNSSDVLATTNYGFDFTSIVRKNNIIGVQFHPEKSHKYGMQLLKNFAELC